MKDLAIVVPAYKSKFLRLTLDSLVNQTDKNFNVYIGDDFSPENLEQIINEYGGVLNISYQRFSNNIGSKNLVNQWNRCIELINTEDWVWLFSDDDLADANCVEVFRNTLIEDSGKFDVYRFDTRIIDDEGRITNNSEESPPIESSENMAFNILMGHRGNSMPDHIFRRKKLFEANGFLFTYYAQAADWASSIFFSYETGIKTMKNAKVSWRYGNYNISGMANKAKFYKIKGHVCFLKWVYRFFLDKSEILTSNDFRNAVKFNLDFVIRNHYKGIGLENIFDILSLYKCIKYSCSKSIILTIQLFLNQNSLLSRFKRKLKNIS